MRNGLIATACLVAFRRGLAGEQHCIKSGSDYFHLWQFAQRSCSSTVIGLESAHWLAG
jgi:hypothetical protein